MVIWKYLLEVTDVQHISMPQGAQILSVQTQVGQPTLWALVNKKLPHAPRRIITVGTGNPFPSVVGEKFIGTYQLHDGALVFHVFEA